MSICIGIDASNLRGVGGGRTHLRELLSAAQPGDNNFERIVVWGGSSILAALEDRPWLTKIHPPMLNGSLPAILYWQRFFLDRLAHEAGCDILFIPGGSYGGSFRPFVTMHQNQLPFEWMEARRYGFSTWTLKFILLRYSQLSTFKRSDGLIFLSEYARKSVSRFLGKKVPRARVIPHGVEDRFRKDPKLNRPISSYNRETPFRLLYVSQVTPYKHQWHVMDATWRLRQAGFPVTLDLVGPIVSCKKRFFEAIARFDSTGEWIRSLGVIPFTDMHATYHDADVFVFASSCETQSIILLEAMSAGLPIACSNRGPMPEVLGAAGVYFDPEKPDEIAQAVRLLLEDPVLRQQKALLAHNRAETFSWNTCAKETFELIGESVQKTERPIDSSKSVPSR